MQGIRGLMSSSSTLKNANKAHSNSFETLPQTEEEGNFNNRLSPILSSTSSSLSSRAISPLLTDSSPVLIITASYDHTIRFWDILQGTCIATLQHNESQVNSLKISPDRKFLVVAGNPNIRVFDIEDTLSISALAATNSPDFSASTANIQAKNIIQSHSGNVISIGFPLSCLWMFSASTDGTLKIWDFPGLKCQKEFSNKSAINKAILHPNQAEIIIGDESGYVKVIDLLKGIFTVEMCPEDNVPVSSIAFSDDGELLAVSNESGNVYIWACKSNQSASNGFTPLHKITSAHIPYVTNCLFSPNSQILITMGSDSLVKNWAIKSTNQNTKTIELSSTLIGHNNWVWDASFSADSSFILTGSSDNTARLWDVVAGEMVSIYSGHSKAITAVAMNDVKVSPFDGDILAVAACQNFGLKGSGRLYIIELSRTDPTAEARILQYFDFKDGIFDVTWSEVDRNGLVVGGGDCNVYYVNLGVVTKPFPILRHDKEISSIDWCPLRQDKFLSTSWDGTIRISSSRGVSSGKNGNIIRGHSGVVNEARWSPRHGNLLISVSSDRTARLWDDRQESGSSSAVISPDESLMVQDFMSVDWNKYDEWNIVTGTPSDLLFWDIRSLARGPVSRIPLAHRRAIKRVRYSPWQGNKLASVGFDMTLRMWDLTSLNPRGLVFDHYSEFVTGLDWSNFERNKLFTCSWDETVRLHK